jgi:WD40 repeat protein
MPKRRRSWRYLCHPYADGDDKRLVLQTGHTWANSLAWSPDGILFATGGMYDPLVVWDAARGQRLRVLEDQPMLVWSVAWSPDGTKLVSASMDNTVRV